MFFRLETKIEPTMTRRSYAVMHMSKLTYIGRGLTQLCAVNSEGSTYGVPVETTRQSSHHQLDDDEDIVRSLQ